MRPEEYRRGSAVRGGLLFMEGVPRVAYGDRVVIKDVSGQVRHGQVIRTASDVVVVQVFEGTDALDLEHTWARFLDETYRLPVSRALLGRVFNGAGEPRDDRPPLLSDDRRDVNGTPINPAARAYPREFIQTGLSAIDGLNSLVRGQKLPIFSGAGLPHNELAAQIVRQARLPGHETQFAVVLAAMGISYEDARFYREDLARAGALGNVVVFTNLADDPPIERLLLPRMAMTAAEYLAFDQDLHVLVVMTDMTHYAEALREVGTALGEVPARKGYPGYLYSDLAALYERAGRMKGHTGSVTMMPIVSMPSDDITHPIPDLTGYITEGQIVLSRRLHSQGVYPPVDVPPSLSRLMKDGIGEGLTRGDHGHVANQLYASYAHALEVRNLASIIGPEDLSEADRRYLRFAEQFEQQLVSQTERDNRDIEQTLDIAWEVLSALPVEELARVSEQDLQKYYRWGERDSEAEEDEAEGGTGEPDQEAGGSPGSHGGAEDDGRGA